LGPLDTAATNRPIVPAPGDYDDGEIGGMMGRGTEVVEENLPQCRFVHHKPHMLPGREPGPPRWEASDQPLELWHGQCKVLPLDQWFLSRVRYPLWGERHANFFRLIIQNTN
jgi:hypothetical protein